MLEYTQQLSSLEWKEKRRIILERDNYKCQICQNKFEKDLSCGLAINTDHRNDDIIKKFSIVTFNKQVIPKSDITLSINRKVLLRLFDCIPDYFWAEYKQVDPDTKQIYVIRSISKEDLFRFKDFIINQERIKKYDKSIIKKGSQVEYSNQLTSKKDEKLKIIQDINKVNSEDYHEVNIYFNKELALSGSKMPLVNIFGLDVHHKVYRKDKLAWEYPNDDLITLCCDCHKKLHRDHKIICINEQGEETGKLTRCFRCNGAGYISKFSHIEEGICFRCRGNRFEEFIDKIILIKDIFQSD